MHLMRANYHACQAYSVVSMKIRRLVRDCLSGANNSQRISWCMARSANTKKAIEYCYVGEMHCHYHSWMKQKVLVVIISVTVPA